MEKDMEKLLDIAIDIKYNYSLVEHIKKDIDRLEKEYKNIIEQLKGYYPIYEKAVKRIKELEEELKGGKNEL